MWERWSITELVVLVVIAIMIVTVIGTLIYALTENKGLWEGYGESTLHILGGKGSEFKDRRLAVGFFFLVFILDLVILPVIGAEILQRIFREKPTTETKIQS